MDRLAELLQVAQQNRTALFVTKNSESLAIANLASEMLIALE